jgi:hypothetical protein
MSELSQKLRAKGDHYTAYAIEILEERCAYYVKDLEVAAAHFLTIRDWLGEGKLNAIDNLADIAARSIAQRLPAIFAHGQGASTAPSAPPTPNLGIASEGEDGKS